MTEMETDLPWRTWPWERRCPAAKGDGIRCELRYGHNEKFHVADRGAYDVVWTEIIHMPSRAEEWYRQHMTKG